MGCIAKVAQDRYAWLRDNGRVGPEDDEWSTQLTCSPLHLTVRRGHHGLAKLLIEHGALSSKDQTIIDSLLAIAVSQSHAQMVELLITQGSSVILEQDPGALLAMALNQILSYSDHSLLRALLRTDPLVSQGDLDKIFVAFEDDDTLVSHEEIAATAVAAAAQAESDAALNLLSRLGAGVDSRFSNKQTALHHVARTLHFESATRLLKLSANVNVSDDRGYTPLMEAVQEEGLQMVKMLIQHGANVNMQADSGQTAVNFAAECRSTEMLAVLMLQSEETKAIDKKSHKPLALTSCKTRSIRVGPHRPNNNTPLASHGSSPATLPVEQQTIVERPAGAIDHGTDTKFIQATNANGLDAFVDILEDAKSGTIDDAWKWALNHIEHRNINGIVIMLLQRNAPINAADLEGRSMIQRAADVGNHALFDLLATWGANLELEVSQGRLLECAIHANDKRLVRSLLQSGADLDRILTPRCDNRNASVLHIVITRWKTHSNLLPLLLQYEPNLEVRAKIGYTPLDLAISLRIVDAVALLVKAGAIVYDKSVRASIEQGSLAIVRLLLHSRATIGTFGDLLYWTIVRFHSEPVVGSSIEVILECVKGKDHEPDVPAYININHVDDSGHTALHYLVLAPESQIEICLTPLIEAGANLEARSSHRWTPLHMAAFYGNVCMVRTLVESGANTLARTSEDKYSLDIARERKHGRVIDFLEKAESERRRQGWEAEADIRRKRDARERGRGRVTDILDKVESDMRAEKGRRREEERREEERIAGSDSRQEERLEEVRRDEESKAKADSRQEERRREERRREEKRWEEKIIQADNMWLREEQQVSRREKERW